MSAKSIISRVVLSAMALLLFGTIGVLVAAVRPFDSIGDSGRIGGEMRAGRDSPTSPEKSPVPVPPYTELTLSNATSRGNYYRYQSRLSIDGLWEFYRDKLSAAGWKRDARLDVLPPEVSSSGALLSFRQEGRRCIIYVEPGTGLTNMVTLLVVPASKSVPARFMRRDEHREKLNR